MKTEKQYRIIKLGDLYHIEELKWTIERSSYSKEDAEQVLKWRKEREQEEGKQ